MRLANAITVTSILSVLLHGVVVAVLLVWYNQTISHNAVGQGVDIELISSIKVASQDQTDLLKQQAIVQTMEKKIVSEKQDENKKLGDLVVLTSLVTTKNTAVPEESFQHAELPSLEQSYQTKPSVEDVTTKTQSTSASDQKHSILELLHTRIAENKRYPSMAKRQRREGVSTVSFVLHPSGMIEKMHLINSSETTALDRAALSAVKKIEPFVQAQNYLKQAETFKVDVVFKLL